MSNRSIFLYFILFIILILFAIFYIDASIRDRHHLYSNENPDPDEMSLTKTQILKKIINNYTLQHLFITSWYFDLFFAMIFSMIIIYFFYDTGKNFIFYVVISALLIFGIGGRLNFFNFYHTGAKYHLIKILNYNGKLSV